MPVQDPDALTEGRRCTKRTTARGAARADRAFAYHRQGFGFDYIAKELDYADRSGARKAVERGRVRWLSATEEDLRAEKLEGLDLVQARLMSMIDCEAPDLKAIDLYLKIWDRQVKLLGIGARPTPPHVPGGGIGPNGLTKGEAITRYSELAKIAFQAAQMGYLTPPDDDADENGDNAIAGRASDSTDAAAEMDDEDELVPQGKWIAGKWVLGRLVGDTFVPSDQIDRAADANGADSREEAEARATVAEAFRM